jgi:hypothetical protein
MFSWLRKKTSPQTHWCASAYMTNHRLVIHSCSRTYNNRGWYNQPVFPLAFPLDVAEIGARLRAALAASVWDSQTDDSDVTPHPVVLEAGYKSWDALEKHSRLVNVETDKQTISFTSNRPAQRGEGKGFLPLGATIDIPWSSSDPEVGNALLSAFERATGKNVG